MSKVHLHVSLVGLSHPFTCILCRTAGATDSSSNWKNVTCAKCLKPRPAERNEFQCAARGCDGCTVCQPKKRRRKKRQK